MNKKSIGNMIKLFLSGGVVGFIGIFAIDVGATLFAKTGLSLDAVVTKYTLLIFALLVVILFIPAVFYLRKGVNLRKLLNALSDDEMGDMEVVYDTKEKLIDRYFSIALSFNTIFLIMSLMHYGMSFTLAYGRLVFWSQLFVFLGLTIMSSIFEIKLVHFIKKNDPRIKGDPTTLSFQKDYVASCDEAEQLRIYKIGYKSFVISRNMGMGMIALTIVLNITFQSGNLPILISCLMVILMQLSYTYYELK